MRTHFDRRAIFAAMLTLLLSVAPFYAAKADPRDYEFRLVESAMKKGDGAVIAALLIDKRSGKPVPDAVIVVTRLDMAPDGMETMISQIEPLPSLESGTYRFKANLSMEGGWRLSLGAKVQGETGLVESKLILKAVPEPVKAHHKIRFYRNPMGLPDTSPVPKKDSMGMDYIPVFEGDEDESGIVKISPGKVQRTGVRSVPATLQKITKTIRAPGIVALDERRISVISARVDAFVEQVASVTAGESVTKNQPLVTLFSTEIAAAAAQFITELATDSRGVTTGGAKKRLENLGVPSEEIAGIERSRKVPPNMVWRAPQGGIVLERNVIVGMKMASGTTLFRIADATRIWVLADVTEQGLASLRMGAEATIQLRHRPDLTFSGKVSLIYPQVNLETRAARVRIELANPDLVLLPNMFVDVEITAGDDMERIAVPESAVIDSGARKTVLLDRGEGRFEPREVKTGQRGNGFVAILDGVAEGEKVVTAANFLIDAESNLKSALQSLTMAQETSNQDKASMEKQP